MDFVEKVAREMHRNSDIHELSWYRENVNEKTRIMNQARVAIAAMTGASEGMIEAGLEQNTDLGPTEYLKELWDTMVEAALLD